MACGRVSKRAFSAGVLLTFAATGLMRPYGVLAQPGGGGAPPDNSNSSSGSGGGGMPPEVSTSASSTTSAVICDHYGSSADYTEELGGTGTTMTRNTSTTTGCPNHINYPLNPNEAYETPYDAVIAAYPMLQNGSSTTNLSEAQSPTGMMFNGVALYSSWGRVMVVNYETTAFYIEGTTLDACGGHANPDGVYHYHSTPGCLQEQAMISTSTTNKEHSPQLGWSYDGFPVYGQLGPSGIEMKMCGEDGAHSTYCLDLCSGYEAEIDEDAFMYRYYLSCGANESFFPFTTNCYRGCCPEGVVCGGDQVEACTDGATDGYTAAYEPAVGTALTEEYDADLLAGNDSVWVDNAYILDCSLYVGSYEDNTTVTPAPSLAAGKSPAPSPSPVLADGATSAPAVSSDTESPAGETPSPVPADGVTPSPGASSDTESPAGETPSPAPSDGKTPAPVVSSGTGAPADTGADEISGATSRTSWSSILSVVMSTGLLGTVGILTVG